MKKFSFISIVFICILCFSINSFAMTTLYEKSSEQLLNSGTMLTKYQRLTDKGWLSINVLKVDLRDKNTTVSVLTSENGLQTFQNVKTMLTSQKNAIAAINADFFTGNSKKGNSIGMTIKDGKMLTSTYSENEVKDSMASFYIDSSNTAFAEYFSNKIILQNVTRNDAYAISEMNKWTGNYEYPVLHTREWGETTPGNSLGVDLTELIVENNRVQEIRNGLEGTTIPENGFAVCAIGSSAENLNTMFQKGDKVALNFDIGVDVAKIKMAVSGGAVLVKDGIPVEDFSHLIYGTNPRTAVGISRDGKIVYLVTIDGRQKSSVGVTQAEFAEILAEKGIDTAINLDGGGSTTMVARELGDTEATVENSPSDGSLRMVPNAIAVFNTNQTGPLSHIILETDEPNVFVNGERKISIKGYDVYYNPVEIDSGDVEWSCEGVDALVEDEILKAGNESGTVTVKAAIDEVEGTVQVDVLSMPNELSIVPRKATISSKDSLTFQVNGLNKNGYSSSLKNSEVNWKVSGDGAKVEDGVFTATQDGSYIVEVSSGNAASYALVTVRTNVSKVVNDFETNNVKFVNYPEAVSGSVLITTEEFFNGKKSAKLQYDFTKTTETRGAYLRFEEPIVLDKNAQKLKVMFLANNATSDAVKAKVVDANEETKYLSLSKSIEPAGWQELSLSLQNIALPAKLIDLYVVQSDENELTSGYVYFDDVTVEYASEFADAEATLPKDVKGKDEANVSSEDGFKVLVSPELYQGILLENLKNKNLENVMNQESEIVIYPYKSGNEMLANVTKEKVMGDAYTISHYKNLSIITLNIADGGLRTTDSIQWTYLQEDIKKVNKNVLIVLNGNLEDFNDALEKQLFVDMFCDFQRNYGKNIWVIQKGDNTDYAMKRGVRYLTICSNELREEVTLEQIRSAEYISIAINENGMTYEMKKVF